MRKYGYYIFGRNLAIVVEDKTINNKFISPDTAITSAADGSPGIKMHYLRSPGVIDSDDVAQTSATKESDTLNVEYQLAMAIVDFVKAKFAENDKDYDRMQYHMNEFKRRVQRYQNNRVSGSRMMIPPSPYAVR